MDALAFICFNKFKGSMSKHKQQYLLGQHLILIPDRALFWREEKLLIVADPHFGKGQTFRENGIPVPGGTTAGDLKRLSCLMDQLNPKRLLVLGDLIHDRIDNPVEFNRLIDRWRRRHKEVLFLLATGNHDLRAGEPPAQFRFDQVASEILIDPFIFSHKPKPNSSVYGIAGHLHPAVTVTGKGRLKETLPCFCFSPRSALMPSFGSFTGNQVIRPTIDDGIYVTAGEEVLEIQRGPSL
jgi:DNA ligase-associated metallophosphoesterase